MIETGSTVRIHYTLTVDGREIDTSRGGEPLTYVHGRGQMISGLERQLEGLGPGDRKTAVVEPEAGYGQPTPDAIHKVPRDAFGNADALSVGALVEGEMEGGPIRARITEIAPDGITVDFNHPLAGKVLHFDVEIVDVT
jgi:FKBP-type peptidyl-prolyl cis-trans isomerase SlyD